MSVCRHTSGIEAPDLTSLLEQFEETQGEWLTWMLASGLHRSAVPTCLIYFHSLIHSERGGRV